MNSPETASVEHTMPIWPEIEMPKFQPNRTAWLLTCVDLTSLLVGFFVLVFSTQTLKREKWEEITGSFQAQFAPATNVVVPVIPDGGDNAVVRVTGGKSGLGYLDTLLHQRVENDALWSGLRAERHNSGGETDLRYILNDTHVQTPDAAWLALAGAMRGWKNSVGVRAVVEKQNVVKGAETAARLAKRLADGGVTGVFTETVIAQGPARFELVVRAR